NDREVITTDVMYRFLDDCADIGVRGISLVSDGESTLSPAYVPSIQRGSQLGISMASGTNAFNLTRRKLEQILPYLTYLRVNFSAGTPERYAKIMGVNVEWFNGVVRNIGERGEIKKGDNLPVTIGMKLVLWPKDADKIFLLLE